ncbi:MAG: SpoIIE family protein phosphatase [Coriobacteriia bacterium]|nr:SpoIIE family protein phosphatase [Coriobacteriia bacterium]
MGSLSERTHLSTALNDIDIKIHSKLSFDEIIQAALDGFVEALGADAGDVKQCTGDEWIVRYVRGFGPGTVGTRLAKADAPVAERVASTGGPVTIADYLAESEDFYVGFPRTHTLRATLAVPLIIRDQVEGCLFAWMRTPRQFTPAEVDFARRMAASLALALENARLFDAEHRAVRRAKRAERRLQQQLQRTQALLAASDALTSTTDQDELLERLAAVILEATGISRVFINLIDAEMQMLTPKIASGGLVRPAGDVIPFARLSGTARRAIKGRTTTLLDYELPSASKTDRAIAKANQARLVLFTPLMRQDRIIGHISLDEPGKRHNFSSEQIRIVETIAAQAAIAIENAQLFEREHRIAEMLQQAILTKPEPIEGLQLASLYQPASAAAAVGGDFYDVLDLGEDRVALLIGDVSGKGVEAARRTSFLRDGTRAYLLESDDPARVLERLNGFAYRFMPPEKFATVFLGILDRSTGVLRYAGAGHPPPVVVGSGPPVLLEQTPGLLGAFDTARFATLEVTIEIGDVLVLVTDGVTEARNASEMLGEEGVLALLDSLRTTPVHRLPGTLLDAVKHFSGGRLHDDVVIVCVARSEV